MSKRKSWKKEKYYLTRPYYQKNQSQGSTKTLNKAYSVERMDSEIDNITANLILTDIYKDYQQNIHLWSKICLLNFVLLENKKIYPQTMCLQI